MKKLMTSLAVCAVAGIVSAQSVVSANVVGYNNVATVAGLNLYAPAFTTVGTNAQVGQLSAIRGATLSDGDQIQFMDADGNIPLIYAWFTAAGQAVAVDGWYDGDFNLVDATLPQGVGYFIYAQNPGSVVQNAGEVKDQSVTTTIPTGLGAAGNATPTARTLSRLVLGGNATDGDQIQFVDADGNVPQIYAWFTAAGQAVAVDGWYDGDFNLVDGPIAASQGVLIYAQNGCTLTVPSPFAI